MITVDNVYSDIPLKEYTVPMDVKDDSKENVKRDAKDSVRDYVEILQVPNPTEEYRRSSYKGFKGWCKIFTGNNLEYYRDKGRKTEISDLASVVPIIMESWKMCRRDYKLFVCSLIKVKQLTTENQESSSTPVGVWARSQHADPSSHRKTVLNYLGPRMMFSKSNAKGNFRIVICPGIPSSST